MQHNQNNNLSTTEKRRVASLTNLISEIERRASKLKTAIQKAKSDLDSTTINVAGIADEAEDFFKAYRGQFVDVNERRQLLQCFINDMTPMIDRILAEAKPYRQDIADICMVADDRAKTIAMLEEQHQLDGDLPADQRKLLLELRTKAA